MISTLFTQILPHRFGVRPSQILLLLGDALALQCVLIVAVGLRFMWGDVSPSLYKLMSLLLLSGPIFTVLLGGFELPVPPPHREVKQMFLSVTMAYLVILTVLFMTQQSVSYSRIILVAAWFGSVFAVPVVRGALRRYFCRYSWWGRPVVFLHEQGTCCELWKEIEEHPERGLVPVACLPIDEHDPVWEMKIADIQNIYPQPLFIRCTTRKVSTQSADFVTELSRVCGSLLLVPNETKEKDNFWLAPRILGTTMAFLVRQNLTDARRLRVKRFIDLCLASGIFCVALPFGFLVALCIRINSKGSPLYTQERLGQNGQKIRIYKFRTMVKNADEVLDDFLCKSPQLQAEWETDQKLKEDPRITKVGAWLRKTSIDELPQILNVLNGTMSLVGPRPIVENEIERYGEVYLEYREVKPGITGLWQVSGRNNTTYQRRVWLDHYYVTNWSVWMDLWILARTIPVVLRGHGAY